MPWKILEKFTEGRTYYTVECHCGSVEKRRKDHVDAGRTRMCKSCASKETAANHGMPSTFEGCGGLSKTHYSHIKFGAKLRGISFDISIEFLWELFLQQENKCALTGTPIVLEPKIKNNNVDWDTITASLDRIDSGKGYTEDNVQWVHKRINRFKNNYSTEEFLEMCRQVVEHDRRERQIGREDKGVCPV